jgi:type III secretory pathway component EscR
MHRFLGTILLGMALMSPAVVKGEEHHYKRYYDRDARDWHEWNEREERAYRHYMEEKRERREWARLRRAQQREYWRWRHRHPDSMLFR